MDLMLSDKRALVTASSRGIGAVVARRLAAEGCEVIVQGRNVDSVASLAADIRLHGGRAGHLVGDLTDRTDIESIIVEAAGVDILVNNAGPFSENTWETARASDWTAAFEGNVLSAVRLTMGLADSMRDQGWGRVINIGSRADITPLPNMVAYSAAKAAVVNMTVTLASHLTGTGITANTVSPGVIVTDSMREMFIAGAPDRGWPSRWEELEQHVVNQYAPNPTGRLGTPEDIAAAIAFLASPLAGYVNGANLRVDGGITATA